MVVKSNGNMYPDKDTWNPLGGECIHDCNYCYRKNWKIRSANCDRKYSGDIRLWEPEFRSLGEGHEIFVCSMMDLFAENVPDEYIIKVLEHCKKYDNLYLLQSKNPARFTDFYDCLPKKVILGTTIETNRNFNGYSKAPHQSKRAESMANLRNIIDEKNDDIQLMISIEPIMDFDPDDFFSLIKLINPDYVSIGADSKNNDLSEPSRTKSLDFIKKLKDITHVKIKDNLARITGEW